MQTKNITILYMLLFPLYILSSLIPKNKKLFILGSSLGQHFADNPKYIYMHLEKANPSFEYCWITKNKELYEKKKSKNFLYLYSCKGIYYLLRGKYLVISHQVNDLFPPLHGRKTIIQLWHGTPLKRLGYDRDQSLNKRSKNTLKKFYYAFFGYLYYMKADYVIVSAQNQKQIFSSAFGIPQENVLVLGQPRNDILLNKQLVDNNYTDKLEFLLELSSYESIISWLPTHRHGMEKGIINLMDDYGFKGEEINERLIHSNSLLVIKPHFLELEVLKNRLQKFSNIYVYTEADPYPLLAYTDILVTDYSSIFFDFSLTNKPIVFAPFDYKEYVNQFKDFYYDYDALLKDYPQVFDWETLIKGLEKYKHIKSETNSLRHFNDIRDNSCKEVTSFLEYLSS
ncbi:CDP-glycerol glycerophosphotransferase family protein [Priestia megaterium]|uniref:CDP-glycerol glycerophosphotransferase family protein n=1 Tax=Priestia megaterium TaxID=1404 RepID=UPI001CD247C1|nr:CDP-glycerol glycerophosphotransferase family protein [Priestia megaterium]